MSVEMQRVVSYIESAEAALCDEHHLGEWPSCDGDDHDEGRSLLAALHSDLAAVMSHVRQEDTASGAPRVT